ncbi:elongation factor P [Erythrobacter oryzae]|uniref:elongation factor P n=1 Tax=Erythrobacter oryzae TaxID=3019556 RepID=UPI00255589B4|nr:elongation factor P [Erythrobacter sp. COR-2]
MKTRYVFLLVASAAATAAALLPSRGNGQDQSTLRAASRPAASAGTPSGGMLGILRHGNWECALPGDAGGNAFEPVAAEAFRIGTASSYESPAGNGIYLLRGTEVVFTRGPKKDQRFKVLGENTLQKLAADGSLSKMICTRVSSGN